MDQPAKQEEEIKICTNKKSKFGGSRGRRKVMMQKPDIVPVIETYTELKKRGSYLWGLCPLPDHTEKTPSFRVNTEKQFFYCFGCHVHGDVITFIMKQEGLSFVEAISRLGIDSKPHILDPTELRKRELVKAFRYWSADYHSDLCRLFRTLQKAKEKVKTETDLEELTRFYHAESTWLYRIEILQGNDSNEKLKLYERYINNGLI